MPTTTRISHAVRHIANLLPCYVVQGRALYRSDVNSILRGIYVDRSQDKDIAYVSAFFWPLCVPTDVLPLSYGFRVTDHDGRQRWNLAEADRLKELGDCVVQQTEPYHAAVSTPSEAAQMLISTCGEAQPQVLEAIGVLQACDGRHVEALESLDRISKLGLTPRWPHEHAFYERVDLLRRLLRTDLDAARNELERRGRFTSAKLKLDDILKISKS